MMHLGMSGSFSVEVRGQRENDRIQPLDDARSRCLPHVVGGIITFTDPRRFGVMDLLTPETLASHLVLPALGPEPLSADFDAAALARACKGRKTSLKAALLDQRVVAGLGNIYVSEALHQAALSPHRRASTIATRSGTPREAAARLAIAVKRVIATPLRARSIRCAIARRVPRLRPGASRAAGVAAAASSGVARRPGVDVLLSCLPAIARVRPRVRGPSPAPLSVTPRMDPFARRNPSRVNSRRLAPSTACPRRGSPEVWTGVRIRREPSCHAAIP